MTYAVTFADVTGAPPSRSSSQRLQRPEQRVRKKDGPRKRAAPSPSKRRTQKRPHTATGRGTRDRAALIRDSSEDGDNEDERCTDRPATTSIGPIAFLTSDFEGLKKFLRMRLEELTMKPLRPIVTEWVKLLVPRRQAMYGPYHKRHPDEDAPAPDPAPHWWPTGIEYIEPSHLPKTGVLDLAVDLMLQHRDTDVDEVKRRKGWTKIMRTEAEWQVNKTAKGMFSSSKDPGFSESMKARALDQVLPELFDVVQSYEDYVAQNDVGLLNDPNATRPNGTQHTYLPVPRPKQPLPRKRVRIEPAASVLAAIKDEHHDESGSETEVDERMERVTQHYLRRQERAQATTAESPAANAQVHKVEAPSPAEMPMDYSTSAGFESDDRTSTGSCTSSSFNQSLNDLQISDAKGGNFAEVSYGYEMYQPMQEASMFSNCQSQFHPYPAQVMGTGPYSMYNTYPRHGEASSFGSSVTPGFTYERNGIFSPAPCGTPLMQTTNSFNGLPYDFDVNQGPSLHNTSPQYVTQPCGGQ